MTKKAKGRYFVGMFLDHIFEVRITMSVLTMLIDRFTLDAGRKGQGHFPTCFNGIGFLPDCPTRAYSPPFASFHSYGVSYSRCSHYSFISIPYL